MADRPPPPLDRAVAALVADLEAQARDGGGFDFVAADDPREVHIDFDAADLVRAVAAALAAAGGTS